MRKSILALIFVVLSCCAYGQPFTTQDTLRGSITPERAWWDLNHYDLQVTVDPENQSISGSNRISFTAIESDYIVQVDLQEPLSIENITQDGKELLFFSEGPAHFVKLQDTLNMGESTSITVHYAGKPHVAVRPPWDGGITWQEDDNGLPLIASSCQGIGASIWWPNKDHMYDEVDSMDITLTVPDHLMGVANGKLINVSKNDGQASFHWKVRNPINNYGVNLSVGDYVHFGENYRGEGGDLDLDYYVIRDNEKKAREQFKQVPIMMDAFEHWFGPYPFYEDGFKLIEVPYLGMEHQSAVTYGNGYANGYRGMDLSGSGWGLLFDYIIIHEAGHEWFANNVTYRDRADMWVHEGFTAYSECLFVEYHHGKDAGAEYVRGTRRGLRNDKPIIAPYGVNAMGSGDMYFKGANMLHTLRQVVNNDDKWRKLLRAINSEFYHQTITSAQLESFMAEFLELDLNSFFDQYLRTSDRPILEYYTEEGKLRFRWTHVVDGFAMPIKVMVNDVPTLIAPSDTWRGIDIKEDATIEIDPNYYVAYMKLK